LKREEGDGSSIARWRCYLPVVWPGDDDEKADESADESST
jgi:hypothetical protein